MFLELQGAGIKENLISDFENFIFILKASPSGVTFVEYRVTGSENIIKIRT